MYATPIAYPLSFLKGKNYAAWVASVSYTHLDVYKRQLMNYKGIVVEVLGNKAKVNIESMGLSLSAVFDVKNLEILR